jgi:hypothetical protein
MQKFFELNPPQGGLVAKNPDADQHYAVDPLAD